MVTQLGGLVGGLVATIVMTMLMMGLGDDSPPPTAVLWSKYVGGGAPSEYMMQGMVLHMLYGIGAGWVFALLGTNDLIAVMSLDTVTGGVVNGLIYGAILFVVAAVLWTKIVLDMDPEPQEMGMNLVMHLVYGVILGAIVGLGLF